MTTMDDRRVEPARLVAAHELGRAFYRHQLHCAPGPRRYVESRGLGALVQSGPGEPWHLGYAPPGWANLVDHLTHAGFTRDELLAAGLATTSSRSDRLIDRFRDRIMFPIHDPNGLPIAFIGRAAPGAKADVPKYLNTLDTAIYHKGHTLYGLGEQRERIAAGWRPVIVEGPFDVIAIHLAFRDGDADGAVGIAACGSTLTDKQAGAITNLPGARHGITTAYDNDTAGRTATLRAFNLLPCAQAVTAATLPDGTDPGDLAANADDLARLRRVVGEQARPLAEVIIDIELGRILSRHPDALHFIESRLGVIRHLASRIAHLPPHQVVDLADYIADAIGAPLAMVTQAVIDAIEDSG